MGAPGHVAGDPGYAAHAAGDSPPVRRRSADARPTLVVRIHRRRWVPITAVALACVAGALVVMLVVNRGGDASSGSDPGTLPPGAGGGAETGSPARGGGR